MLVVSAMKNRKQRVGRLDVSGQGRAGCSIDQGSQCSPLQKVTCEHSLVRDERVNSAEEYTTGATARARPSCKSTPGGSRKRCSCDWSPEMQQGESQEVRLERQWGAVQRPCVSQHEECGCYSA